MLQRTPLSLIQFVKKRVSTEEKHLPFGEQISCKLCHARFTTLTAYNAHKLMPTHASRERWLEVTKWMAVEGRKFLDSAERADFAKFGKFNGGRRSRMHIDETFNAGVVPPPIHAPAKDIIEPANNRWPNDVRPRVRVSSS